MNGQYESAADTQARTLATIARDGQANKKTSGHERGVQGALSGLSHNLQCAGRALQLLSERLEASGVLRPSAPASGATGAAAPQPAVCAMAEHIRHEAALAFAIECHIQELIERLEV